MRIDASATYDNCKQKKPGKNFQNPYADRCLCHIHPVDNLWKTQETFRILMRIDASATTAQTPSRTQTRRTFRILMRIDASATVLVRKKDYKRFATFRILMRIDASATHFFSTFHLLVKAFRILMRIDASATIDTRWIPRSSVPLSESLCGSMPLPQPDRSRTQRNSVSFQNPYADRCLCHLHYSI